VRKADAKATDTTAQEAATPTSNAADVTGATPAVQPTQATPRAPDDFHGQGGLYRMKDGQRVLVAQTQPETTKERK